MDNKENGRGGECRCPWCHGGKHVWLRLLVGIIILIVVFWLGVKVGELKGYFGYGYPMMGGWWGYNMMNSGYGPNGYYYGPGMMRGWYPQQSTTTSK